MRKFDNQRDWMHALSIASGAGLTLFGMIIFGGWVGIKIDRFFALEVPYGLIGGSLLGAIMGLYAMIMQMIQ